ncbi:MAG: hypothetical protein DHS20C15_13080 [Planctomycetota bacterium]|nr:MAG: hypothetical protein DHS20C15_13080 [Planctomycetota bacterium]
MFFRTLAVLATSALLFTACSEAQAAVETVNENCPEMGKPVVASEGTLEWQGHTVGFCCGGCKEEFEARSPEEQAAKLIEHGTQLPK